MSCFPLFVIRSYSFHLYFVVRNTVLERQLLRLGYPLKSELRRERVRVGGGEGYEIIVEEQAKREVTGEMRGALFGAENEHDC